MILYCVRLLNIIVILSLLSLTQICSAYDLQQEPINSTARYMKAEKIIEIGIVVLQTGEIEVLAPELRNKLNEIFSKKNLILENQICLLNQSKLFLLKGMALMLF